MIEKELKIILDRDEYLKLFSSFQWTECINQTNYYYKDNLGILKEKDISVRIREINNNYKLQIKIPVSKNKALHIKNEYEETMLEIPNMIESKRISEIIGYEIGDIYLIGKLQTQRNIFWWDDNTQICLDKNTYLNHTDYEIEIEYSDEIDLTLLNLLGIMGLDFTNEIEGKYSRFMECYYNKTTFD